MKNENVKQVLTIISDKLPEDKLMLFKQRLESASDDLVDEIICTELHNPTFILLFSIFLGGLGVDRFLIGDIGLGIGKLLLGWVSCGLWPIIDIFFTYRKAKEKNLNKLMLLF